MHKILLLLGFYVTSAFSIGFISYYVYSAQNSAKIDECRLHQENLDSLENRILNQEFDARTIDGREEIKSLQNSYLKK